MPSSEHRFNSGLLIQNSQKIIKVHKSLVRNKLRIWNTCFRLSACLLLSLSVSSVTWAESYKEIIQTDQPFAWWRFDDAAKNVAPNLGSAQGLSAKVKGAVKFDQPGPRPSINPDFSPENRCLKIPKGKNYLVVDDPENALAFANKDAITIEAWVQLDEDQQGTYRYIIGKGRTHNKGFSQKNQNFALRLLNDQRGMFLSFFFVHNGEGSIEQDGHRWNTNVAVPNDYEWHHVAVTYKFGDPKSIRGYIDGSPVTGKWDMAGETKSAPIVDKDQTWIGSAMGGNSTLAAKLDEIAIYRKILTEEQIKKHVTIKWEEAPFSITKVRDDAPADHVRIELMEGVPADRSWKFRMKEPKLLYETDLFALQYLPRKYNPQGLIIDRQYPALLHMLSKISVDGGEYEFILRSLDAARLVIDGEIVADTPFLNPNTSAHQKYYYLPDYGDDLLSIPAGHFEKRVTVNLEPGEHVVSMYRLVGHKGKGTLVGEQTVAYAKQGQPFHFLSPTSKVPYTDPNWLAWRQQNRKEKRLRNQNNRLQASQDEQKYWNDDTPGRKQK